jgi:hypothetical protein
MRTGVIRQRGGDMARWWGTAAVLAFAVVVLNQLPAQAAAPSEPAAATDQLSVTPSRGISGTPVTIAPELSQTPTTCTLEQDGTVRETFPCQPKTTIQFTVTGEPGRHTLTVCAPACATGAAVRTATALFTVIQATTSSAVVVHTPRVVQTSRVVRDPHVVQTPHVVPVAQTPSTRYFPPGWYWVVTAAALALLAVAVAVAVRRFRRRRSRPHRRAGPPPRVTARLTVDTVGLRATGPIAPTVDVRVREHASLTMGKNP